MILHWCLVFAYLYNGNCLTSNVGVDQYWESKFIYFLASFEKLCQKIPKYHWFKKFEKNNDTWYFSVQHDKYNIIIIVQWKTAHNVHFLFHLIKRIMKSISITHPHNFDCWMKITNNPPWIALHLTWGDIIGNFSMCCLLALNRVNNTRALFEMISTIKIQKTECSRLKQLITLTGYSSGLP